MDSVQILMNADLTPYPDTSSTQLGLPLAYDPNGSPRPKPLVGTAWTPATRYRTGAELIRWTLDLNNDGVVDASDLAVPDAADANRTLNPDDYELCREVYGDSTGGIKGNNGGTRDRIALIKKPGSGAPPLFRVYLSGDSQPWDWSNGPVPQSRLAEIVRIELNVVAASSQRNYTGRFAETPLTTTVSSIRTRPTSRPRPTPCPASSSTTPARTRSRTWPRWASRAPRSRSAATCRRRPTPREASRSRPRREPTC